jgi:hemerythrin-like metal-binding protein
MALITWDDSLSVKVASIDEQHKKLAGFLNHLHDLMISGKGTNQDELRKILNGLVAYTQEHFSYEEKHMVQYHYEGMNEHVAEHQNFVKEVSVFLDKLNAGNVIISSKILTFLKEWVVTHIKGTDQKYSACFIKNNMK